MQSYKKQLIFKVLRYISYNWWSFDTTIYFNDVTFGFKKLMKIKYFSYSLSWNWKHISLMNLQRLIQIGQEIPCYKASNKTHAIQNNIFLTSQWPTPKMQMPNMGFLIISGLMTKSTTTSILRLNRIKSWHEGCDLAFMWSQIQNLHFLWPSKVRIHPLNLWFIKYSTKNRNPQSAWKRFSLKLAESGTRRNSITLYRKPLRL